MSASVSTRRGECRLPRCSNAAIANTPHRVELKALTSDRFVDFVERKLTEDGVRKIVPSKTLLQQTYPAIVRGERAKPGIEAAIAEAAESLAVPADLQNQIANFIEENPECPWDVAIAKIAQGKE